MSARHWDTAQREQFEGEDSFGVPFDPAVFLTDDSFVTINPNLEFAWCRERVAELRARDGLPPSKPVLLWHAHLSFAFWRSSEGRWGRMQEALAPHLLLDAEGRRVPYPGQQPWFYALDPASPGLWWDLREFWLSELAAQDINGLAPVGLFFDTTVCAPWAWRAMGYEGEAFEAKRAAHNEGRDFLIEMTRRDWGTAVVLVANHAKDPTWPKWWRWTNGVTIEGNPATPAQQRLLLSQYIHNASLGAQRRRSWSCSWNTDASPLFDRIVRTGSHWQQRSDGA